MHVYYDVLLRGVYADDVMHPCDELMDAGTGDGTEDRYFFDMTKSKCYSFTYHGKGGNENNFKSKDECEDKCRSKLIPGKCRRIECTMYSHHSQHSTASIDSSNSAGVGV